MKWHYNEHENIIFIISGWCHCRYIFTGHLIHFANIWRPAAANFITVISLLALSCNYYVEGCEMTTHCKFILLFPAFQDTNNQFWTHMVQCKTLICVSSCAGKTFALKNEPRINSKLEQTKKVIFVIICNALCSHDAHTFMLNKRLFWNVYASWNILYKHFIRGTTEATHLKSQTVKTNIRIYMCIFHKEV